MPLAWMQKVRCEKLCKGDMNEAMMAEASYNVLLKMMVLVCLDCHNKIPQIVWLKQQTFIPQF